MLMTNIDGKNSHTAKSGHELRLLTCVLAADAPVVATVKVEVPVPFPGGVTEAGLSEQVGAKGGVGETKHVSVTGLLKPFIEATLMGEVEDAPAFIELGDNGPALSANIGNIGLT